MNINKIQQQFNINANYCVSVRYSYACSKITELLYEASAKNYILIISQIILVLELLISWYNHQDDCGKYSRNLWSNIRLCMIITVFAVALVEFDLTYGYFSEFELPFVIISLIILLLPFILFIGHIIVARMEITILKLKCRYYIRQVENCLQVHDDHTQG